MKTKKTKMRHELARTNKDGLMGSKSRIHRVKKGKGSYQRRLKHQKEL
jgi:stalled ribosome alternative rescue factor ArfA